MSLSRKQRRANERARRERLDHQQAPVAAPPAVAPSTRTRATGPRTPEGKAISSRNALSHGLTSAKLVLPGENEADFHSLLSGLVEEHAPATITEEILVREMAEQYWRLQRARSQEYKLLADPEQMLERTVGNVADAAHVWSQQLAVAQRYCTRFERGFHRCLTTLRKLQKEREGKEAEQGKSEKKEGTAVQTAPAPIPEEALASMPAEFVLQNSIVTSEHAEDDAFDITELVGDCA